jgi:hypothetical protein
MPELGSKHICEECETRFYDLGKKDATCPQCGSAVHEQEKVSAAKPSKPPVPEESSDESPALAAKGTDDEDELDVDDDDEDDDEDVDLDIDIDDDDDDDDDDD